LSPAPGALAASPRLDLSDFSRRVVARLFSTSSFLLAARLVGAAAGFGVQLVLARNLSAHALGIYFIASSLIVVAGVAAAHGYPSIATRFVSRYRAREKASLLFAFARHAQRSALTLSLVLFAAVAAGAMVWPNVEGDVRFALLAAGATVPFAAAFRLYGSLATATRAFKLAYLPDVSLKPVVMLGALALILTVTGRISLIAAMLCLAGATIILSGAQFLLLARRFPVEIRLWRRSSIPSGPAVRRVAAKWKHEAHAVLIVAIVGQFFPDLAILAATPILTPAEIGALGICLKLAFLAGFFVMLTQNIATPDIADALNRRNPGKRKLSGSCASATAMTLAATIACLFWGENLLALFGAHFANAHDALTVLVAAQLVRAVFGPNNAVLTLVGERRINFAVTMIAVAVLVTGTTALGGLFGLIGAAWAVLLAMLCWCAASGTALYRRTGLRVDLFG
jgi:O-antigen/teichoic acid export membrane protein